MSVFGWWNSFQKKSIPNMTFELGPNIKIWHSKSYFDIWTRAECDILTFKILCWHSSWDRISNFDIRSPILTFQLGPDIILWHSEYFFGILIGAEYRISKDFDIQNPFLTFELGNYGCPPYMYLQEQSRSDKKLRELEC